MPVNEEDTRYKELIRTLNSLQKVSAPPGFESSLMRRINSGEFKKERSPLRNIFSPSRLIPAAAAVAAVLLVFVFNPKAETPDDPLMADPRVREDVIISKEAGTNSNELKKPSERKASSFQRYAGSASNKNLFINKKGLNFRQIRLSFDERQQLNKLKAKFR